MKAALRKDLLLGGGAGTLLIAALVGGALTIGPLLGIDWGNGTGSGQGAEAARLPAIPSVVNPNADALRARARAPRVVARNAQPTTRVAAPRSTARPQAPSIVGRNPQPTATPAPAPSRGGNGDSDAPGVPDSAAVPPPAPAPGLLAPAAVIPATPATPPAAKKMNLRVASVAVESNDDGSPELRLSLAIDRAAAAGPASVPDQVTVRLRPQLPRHADASGPLALSAHVDVVDAPADDSSSDGAVDVPGMQVRVRMSLAPAAAAAPATTPSVADAGAGDGQSQSNVIALSVPLAAFSDPEDHSSEPAEPAAPGTPASTPAPPTEIRLDLAPPADPDQQPQTETATVAAPDTATDEHAPADVPVTVVVDPAPQPPADPAPAPPADPAPQPPADSTPAPQPPADPAPQPPADSTPQPPAYADGQPAPDAPGTTTTETTTPAPDATTTPDASTPAPDATAAPDASGAGSSGS